jgi:hypothetical protein
MPRSANAQLAVEQYNGLQARFQWNRETAWHGIARLLLTCEVYAAGDPGWRPFHNVVVYVDSNRFKIGNTGPNATLRRAGRLTEVLGGQLGISREDLCSQIGLYWHNPVIRPLQYHNLVGHAYRSLIANALQRFGDPEITYEEEVSPHVQFPGSVFTTRSDNAKIDIVAWRQSRMVAMLSVRWRYRHDRVDVIDEAIAYAPAAQRLNPNCKMYAVLGEFDAGRLRNVLANCPPLIPRAAISAAVHFAPQLIRYGLEVNGTLNNLQSLAWLIDETFSWR